jgi:oligopeptide transport system substrate-binding protein
MRGPGAWTQGWKGLRWGTMRKVKWIFLVYLAIVGLVAAGIAMSVVVTPPRRDPQTMYQCFLANLKSLDPAVSYDNVGSPIVANTYESLYAYKYAVRPFELYPQLAEDFPKITDGGTKYTIRIRKGIRFYDPNKRISADGVGPEVKAKDVIYSYKRVADFHIASPIYSGMLQNKIVGLDDWFAYTEKTPKQKVDYDEPVKGLAALDDYTLRIELVRPAPQFTYQMAMLSIVCRDAVEKYSEEEFSHTMVGTGAYALVEYMPEQRLVFVANPIYRGRPDVDGYAKLTPEERLPKIQRLQYDYFKEQIPAWYLFDQKLYDISTIPKESFSGAMDSSTGDLKPEMKARGMILRKVPEQSMYFYGVNMDDPILGKNKPLRQAMSMAHDRKKFIDVYRNGRGIALHSPIPPGFPAWDVDQENPYAKFNLAGAKEKMKEAVRINGGPIPPLGLLMQDSDTESRQYADFFVAEMREIGLELKPEYTTWARYQEKVDNRQTQVFASGWVADYPDEQSFLQMFCGDFAPALGVDYTAYRNPKFDELYRKAAVMERSKERDELYAKMIEIVDEDCTWIVDFTPVNYTIQYDWLSPYWFMDYGGGYRQFLTLDVAKREAERRR